MTFFCSKQGTAFPISYLGGVIAMVRINAALWAAIREKGLWQKDFARVVGDDPSVVSRVINGWYNLDPIRQASWARVLGRKPEELFQA